MGSRVALFVFPLRSVTCLPAPTPLSKKWRCVSAQHFTLTRLTGCTDGSDKSLSSVKCCHGFGRAETPFLGCTVTGTGWVFFCTPRPLFLSTPLCFAVVLCPGHVGLHHVSRPSHTIPALLRAEAALRAQHFHPTTLRMSRLGRDRATEGGGRAAGGGTMM